MHDRSPLRRGEGGRIRFRAVDHASAMIARVEALDAERAAAIFTRFDAARIVAAAETVDRDAALVRAPLAGLTVAIKDLFDEAGETTTAGSIVLAGKSAASEDSTAVSRLKRAGAIAFGRTNLSEFAYSGVGLNPHYGTPGNGFDPSRIPGGSTSGGAVAVALKLADAALGSDTGGSVRIPAALNGLAGFKPTQAAVPLDGTFPLSPSCDSIGPLAPSVADCAALHAVLSQSEPDGPARTDLSGTRFAVLRTTVTDDLDTAVAADFAHALSALEAAGAELVDFEAEEVHEAGRSSRAIVSSDAMDVHQARLDTLAEHGDPRVLRRILGARDFSADERREAHERRAHAIASFAAGLCEYDGLLAPTVPTVAPTIAACEADFDRTNALMLRNPSIFNFLDCCAASVPMHEPGALPTGLMIAGTAGADWSILAIAAAAERALATMLA
ncbi:amidase [Pararhizobium mangrovi]|uniref:Amidase n=1 Tax=Pararhizobium mangrovi TaxID=2590452 RepID=A0A506UHK6_9HYPH|nr:amidase [Pararhizobium mangrovi]TPW32796.1 amidase [Pararhizobium mangrovi]